MNKHIRQQVKVCREAVKPIKMRITEVTFGRCIKVSRLGKHTTKTGLVWLGRASAWGSCDWSHSGVLLKHVCYPSLPKSSGTTKPEDRAVVPPKGPRAPKESLTVLPSHTHNLRLGARRASQRGCARENAAYQTSHIPSRVIIKCYRSPAGTTYENENEPYQ